MRIGFGMSAKGAQDFNRLIVDDVPLWRLMQLAKKADVNAADVAQSPLKDTFERKIREAEDSGEAKSWGTLEGIFKKRT